MCCRPRVPGGRESARHGASVRPPGWPRASDCAPCPKQRPTGQPPRLAPPVPAGGCREVAPRARVRRDSAWICTSLNRRPTGRGRSPARRAAGPGPGRGPAVGLRPGPRRGRSWVCPPCLAEWHPRGEQERAPVPVPHGPHSRPGGAGETLPPCATSSPPPVPSTWAHGRAPPSPQTAAGCLPLRRRRPPATLSPVRSCVRWAPEGTAARPRRIAAPRAFSQALWLASPTLGLAVRLDAEAGP